MSRNAVKTAVSAIQKYYPLRLADKSWDNTGLLVDSSCDESSSDEIRILLTIDLTQAVAEEAIRRKSNLIMAYHPFIFRGLKSITPQDPQQKSLLKLIKNNISVYSPHTAVDSAVGGVNDFLSEAICQGIGIAKKQVIQPNATEPECGMGRILTLETPASLQTLVENVKNTLSLQNVQVAPARNASENSSISTIAICAGSGGSVFKGVAADLYLTGELSHHEALYFTENGSSVIACHHSNSERAFLKTFKQQLEQEIPSGEIVISKSDKDPFQIW